MSAELDVEPLVDEQDPLQSWEVILPLRGINLAGLNGGRLANKNLVGGNKFLGLVEYEEGVHDASDIEAELSVEDPYGPPIARINHPNIRPTLWVVSDMFQTHQKGKDVYYDKRGLALSAIFSLLKTSISDREHMPSVLVASNDYRMDMSDRPRGGKYHFIEEIERLRGLSSDSGILPKLDERPKLSELLSSISAKATRSVVAVVSDLRGPNVWPDHPRDNWLSKLDYFAQRGNEIVAIEVTSKEDSKAPKDVARVHYSPKDRLWVGKRGENYRGKYVDISVDQQQAIDEALDNVGAIHVRLRTDEPNWHTRLTEQLKYPDERVYAKGIA